VKEEEVGERATEDDLLTLELFGTADEGAAGDWEEGETADDRGAPDEGGRADEEGAVAAVEEGGTTDEESIGEALEEDSTADAEPLDGDDVARETDVVPLELEDGARDDMLTLELAPAGDAPPGDAPPGDVPPGDGDDDAELLLEDAEPELLTEADEEGIAKPLEGDDVARETDVVPLELEDGARDDMLTLELAAAGDVPPEDVPPGDGDEDAELLIKDAAPEL